VAAVTYLKEALGLAPGVTCLDLAAGTGKLTRQLVDTGARLIAVEPASGMRDRFASLLPQVRIIEGSAEAIPLPDSSVNAVVVAQAFHWFASEATLREIHRVLTDDGKLALIWNLRDEANDWMFQLTKMLNPFERGTPQYRTGRWRDPFARTCLFSAMVGAQFENPQRGTVETILDRVASISYIAVLPELERQDLLGDVRNLLATHPMTAGRGEFEVPYRTDVFLCSKLT
jgi:SAM-dependent methyltransferase